MTNTVDSSVNRLAYDVSGLNNLKRQASNGSPDGIKKVAQQFESVFVNMMMQSMRKAVPEGGMFSSAGMQLFTSMFDQQIAQQASEKGKGLGLAEMLTKQMSPKTNQIAPDEERIENEQLIENNAQLETSSLFGQSLFNDISSNMSPQALGQLLYRSTKQQKTLNVVPPQLPKTQIEESSSKETVTNFIKEWLEPAKNVAKTSGIPYEVIIAQAALETGWGKYPIKTAENGQQSYNYFGIKADSSWKGNTAEVMTKEYINGKESRLKDSFRAYDTLQQAIEDYTRLLTQNGSRYQSIVNAADAHEAAQILQDKNYATDPNYADKLIQLINRIRVTENDFLTQNNNLDSNMQFTDKYAG